MSLCKTLIHQISSQLNISCKCIRQTIYKFDKLHTVATKPDAGRTLKVTEHQKRPRSNTTGRKRPLFTVFRPFGSDSITVVF